MKTKSLAAKDRQLFKDFLGFCANDLSVYTFENIYIWKAIFDIRWSVVSGNLCVFFVDGSGAFMYLPPLGKNISPAALMESFEFMDGINRRNPQISRIENLQESDIDRFSRWGYKISEKYPEYLCKRSDIAGLPGNKYKSQRACFNHFVRNNEFCYLPLSASRKGGCLRLYKEWASSRKESNRDAVYCGLMEDGFRCLDFIFNSWRSLELSGRVVLIGKAVKAFSLGFVIDRQTFCIAYEVADLKIKGLSQFIFSSFCSDLKDFEFVNIMDDSGLENLRRTKLGYHPVKMIPAYIASRHEHA